MPGPSFRSLTALAVLLPMLFAAQPAPAAGSNAFCGGAATPGDPSDLANVVGDQTLEYAAQQPASIVTCAKGYLLEKCGDHENAHKVFDKCIAAGYVGAMIWKALLLEDGTGVTRDLEAAARLMQRAATSGDPAYGPLGKLHYATMLLQGKGVERNPAEARRWFESAAADGNPEAQEYLKTGYHTGARDQTTLGAGTPPPGALVAGLTGDNASLPTVNPKNPPNSQIAAATTDTSSSTPPVAARKPIRVQASDAPPAQPIRPTDPSPTPEKPVAAPTIKPIPSTATRRLTSVDSRPVDGNSGELWISLALAVALGLGAILQGRRRGITAIAHAQPHFSRG